MVYLFDFWLEVNGDFDSLKLWEEIEYYKVNLLDLDAVYVYGYTSLKDMAQIISICSKYGKVKGDFALR